MEDSCTSDTTAEIKRAQLRAELLASEHTVGASQSLPALDVNFFGSVGRPSDFVRPGGFRRRFLGLQGGGDFRAPLSRVQSLTDTLRSSALVYARATEGAAEGEPELGMGSAATVFTLLKAMLGPTCLFVPRMFSEAGVVDAVLGLFLSCALSGVGMWLLIQVREQSGLAQCTYPDLGRHHGGTAGWVLIEAALVTSQWLYCVGYPIFVAQNTHAILASCLASPPSELCLTLVQLAVCIPYCWVRRVSSLSGAMLIANLCLWSSLLVLCALLVLRLASHGSPLPPAAWADAAPRLETALFASQAVVVFEGIGLVLPVRAAMADPSAFPRILLVSMGLAVAACLAVGLLGYAAYGAATQTFITINLAPSPAALAIRAAFALAVLLTYPLQLFPALQALDTWLGFEQPPEAAAEAAAAEAAAAEAVAADAAAADGWRAAPPPKRPRRGGGWGAAALQSLARSLLVCAGFGFAVSVRYDSLIALAGGLCAVPLAFVYPPLLHYRAFPQQRRAAKAGDLLLMAFGLAMAATSTAISIATWGDGGDASAGTPPAAPPIIGSGPSSEDLIGMA